jgi:hypothetical protein
MLEWAVAGDDGPRHGGAGRAPPSLAARAAAAALSTEACCPPESMSRSAKGPRRFVGAIRPSLPPLWARAWRPLASRMRRTGRQAPAANAPCRRRLAVCSSACRWKASCAMTARRETPPLPLTRSAQMAPVAPAPSVSAKPRPLSGRKSPPRGCAARGRPARWAPAARACRHTAPRCCAPIRHRR